MIVVDPVRPCQRNKFWPYDESCYMSCQPGELDDLHAFASSIGLKRGWFQDKAGGLPHYDLTINKRRQAVQAGAVEVDLLGIVDVMRTWREHRKSILTQGELL